MPNPEFLRLKKLLESNPQYKAMLDTISKSEGTWGKDAYSTKINGGKVDWRKGKDRESLAVGKKSKSNAHGKYQFMNETWDLQANKLGLTGFSPEEQDIAALSLLDEKGALAEIEKGNLKGAIFKAAKTWSSLPSNENGESAHRHLDNSKQTAKSLKTVMGYMQSNQNSFEEENKKLEDLNIKNQYKYNGEKKKSILSEYNKNLSEINKSESSDLEKKAKIHNLNKKHWQEGNFGMINREKDLLLKKREKFIDDFTIGGHDSDENIIDFEDFEERKKGGMTKSKYLESKKEAAKLGIILPGLEHFKGEEITANRLNGLVKGMRAGSASKVEPNQNKYGYTREEFDEQQSANAPDEEDYEGVGGIADDVANATPTETADERTVRLRSEANAKQAEAEKNKPFQGSDLLNSITAPEEYVDPQFEYVPGKQQVPFDALVGLTTGLMGAAAADDVEIKYRDEQISEGMLQYAADIAKIKEIGLDPSTEGALKMKLQDAYQTGLENIVRASNGNRNLVLGNQGQLDKARMAGIVDIAAMDVDRTDKAMAAFGEVQKYINEFESRRDVANNERKYKEDGLKREAGMAVASQGMSNFIDAIQNAKENAPGSMNDMRRQIFQFKATGILPNAKEGEPGHPDYKKAMEVKNDLKKEKKKTYADWINGKTMDEKDVIHNILAKNPNLNPTINDNTEFSELEKMYNEVSGQDEYKSEYQKSKGISNLVTDKLDQEAKEITGESKVIEAAEKEKQHVSDVRDNIQTVPIVKTVAPTIVTAEKKPDELLQQNVANGINGLPSGVNAIDKSKSIANPSTSTNSRYAKTAENPTGMDNDLFRMMQQQKVDEAQRRQTIIDSTSKASNSASQIIESSEVFGQKIDAITSRAEEEASKLATR